MDDSNEPDLGHPDSVIRLASAIHRFRSPEMGAGKKTSYAKSFKSAANHPKAKALVAKADAARASLGEALIAASRSSSPSNEAIVRAANEYLPQINSILLSCKVQPETARLDERLVFEWASGMEKVKKFFKSEALMFELVMAISCEAMGTAGVACDECIAGDFAASGRGFKKAAGIMRFLAEDHLPKWIARGTSVEDKDLPAEASVGICDAFHTFFLAVGQQMAISTVLIKPGTPNYSLLAKLSLAISELMEQFTATMRSKAGLQMSRLDPAFFTLVAFQINLQKALSMYFLARSIWEKKEEHGLAIAMLKESMSAMQTRTSPTSSKGLPQIDNKSNLKALNKDLADFRKHMNTLLDSWTYDNRKVYFDQVPNVVPEDKKLHKGVVMMKPEEYKLADVDPVFLGKVDPNFDENLFQNDVKMARDLQDRLNMG